MVDLASDIFRYQEGIICTMTKFWHIIWVLKNLYNSFHRCTFYRKQITDHLVGPKKTLLWGNLHLVFILRNYEKWDWFITLKRPKLRYGLKPWVSDVTLKFDSWSNVTYWLPVVEKRRSEIIPLGFWAFLILVTAFLSDLCWYWNRHCWCCTTYGKISVLKENLYLCWKSIQRSWCLSLS